MNHPYITNLNAKNRQTELIKSAAAQRRAKARQTRFAVMIILIVILALAQIYELTRKETVDRHNLADQYQDIMPLEDLFVYDGGYAGAAMPEWKGLRNDDAAIADCLALQKALVLGSSEKLVLTAPSGFPVVLCGLGAKEASDVHVMEPPGGGDGRDGRGP